MRKDDRLRQKMCNQGGRTPIRALSAYRIAHKWAGRAADESPKKEIWEAPKPEDVDQVTRGSFSERYNDASRFILIDFGVVFDKVAGNEE